MTGWQEFNNEAVAHAQLAHERADTISFGRYLTSSDFGQAVMENWQSEYLQFSLFILGTIWLRPARVAGVQGAGQGGPRVRSGPEGRASTPDRDSPRWAKVGGLRTFLYSHSLLLVMGAIFLGSWFAHSVTGWTEYNAQQVEHEQPELSWVGYLGSADFWQTTLQNWQSEFLAVGSMVILSVYLRQRGLTGVQAGRRPP